MYGIRACVGLLLLFSILAAPVTTSIGSHGAATGEDEVSAAGWEIADHHVCTDEFLQVDSNVTIRAGGVLELQGCMLLMDSPAYVDRTFSMQDEGLVVRVDAGGELRMSAMPERPAGIARADERYGYTVRAEGNVTSIGLSATPNEIRGLEGSYQGTLALGGFSSKGQAVMEHTRFSDNSGPGLFIIGGGTLDGSNLTFEGLGGLALTNAGKVEVRNLSATSPIGFFASMSRDIHIQGCQINASFYGLWAIGAQVQVQSCAVNSNLIGVQIGEHGVMHLQDTQLGYGDIGAVLRPDLGATTRPTLMMDNVTMMPGEEAQAAVAGSAAHVEVRNSSILEQPGASVFLSESKIVAIDNTIAIGDGPVFNLTNPSGIDIHSNTMRQETAGVPMIVINRALSITVMDARTNTPMVNVAVRSGENEAATGDDGIARLTWQWISADESNRLDWPETLDVHLDAPTYSKRTQAIPGDASAAVIEIGPKAETMWSQLFPLAVVVAIGALIGGLWTYTSRKTR